MMMMTMMEAETLALMRLKRGTARVPVAAFTLPFNPQSANWKVSPETAIKAAVASLCGASPLVGTATADARGAEAGRYSQVWYLLMPTGPRKILNGVFQTRINTAVAPRTTLAAFI